MSKTIKGIKVGTTTISASYTDGGVTKTASVNFTVKKIAGSSGTVSNPASQPYKDGTQTNYSFQLGISGATGTVTYPTSITVKNGSTTITGWSCNSSGVLTVPYTQGVGTYTVTGNITVAESTNYNAVAVTSKTWTITITKKSDASVSVTLASNAGTYNSAATLITAANSSSHGTSAASVGYKYGSAATADSQITWVNAGTALTLTASASAGTYYIYKKWTADGNHSNSSTYTQVGTLTRSTIAGATGVATSDMHIVYSNTTGTRTASGNTGTLSVVSSNTNIATVSVSGTTITVTRKGYGSATITVTAQATTNYNSATSQFTIYCDKAAGQSGSVSNPAAKTFSTSSQTVQLGISGATGTVTYPTSITVKNSGGTSVSGWSCTSAGVVTIPASQTVGTYTVTGNITVAEATNYYAVGSTSKFWTITINKASFTATVSMTGYTYGSSLPSGKPSVSSNPGSGSVSYYYSTSNSSSGGTAWSNMTSTSLNAGTYYMYAVIGETTNYKGYTTSAVQFTVSAADFTVSGTGNKSYVYSGSAQGTGVSVSGLKGGQTATIKYRTTSSGDYTLTSAPQITNVSESPITVYWQVTAPNHTTQTGSYTITINKADAVLPTNWKGDSKVYHNTASLTYTGYSGGTIKFRYDTSGNTNWSSATTTAPTRTAVGNTSVQCMVEGDANHNSTDWSSTVTLTITQAGDARMEVDTFDRTYTGSGQVIAQLKANSAEGIATYSFGLGSNSTSAPTSAGSTDKALSVTNAGTYYVWYKFTSDASHSNNKDWTYVGSVVVDKASRSGAVSCNDVTYGSTVQASVSGNTESGKVTWGITADTGAATISSTGMVTPTQAGKVIVTASVAATANYKAYTADYVSFTIAQKEVGLSWGASTWTYDGSTHSTTCSATGLVGSDTCTVNLSNNSVGKNVGSQTVTASSLSNSNYKLPSSKTKTISITAREVTLTWGTTSWVYDGNPHSTTCTVTNLVSDDTCTVILSGNSITNIGSTTVTATGLSNSNYKLPESGITQTLTINTGLFVKISGNWTPVKAVYKRVSGSWVQQDMTTAFSTSGRYIKSN